MMRPLCRLGLRSRVRWCGDDGGLCSFGVFWKSQGRMPVDSRQGTVKRRRSGGMQSVAVSGVIPYHTLGRKARAGQCLVERKQHETNVGGCR